MAMRGDIGTFEPETDGTLTLEEWHRARDREKANPVHVVRWSESTNVGVGDV